MILQFDLSYSDICDRLEPSRTEDPENFYKSDPEPKLEPKPEPCQH